MAVKQHCDICDRVVVPADDFNGFGLLIADKRQDYSREPALRVVIQTNEGEVLDTCSVCLLEAIQARILKKKAIP